MVYAANLARLQIARGESAMVEATLRQILEARQRLYPSSDWRIAETQALLGAALMEQSRLAEAEPLLIAAAKGLRPIPGLEDYERRANRVRLVTLYDSTGRASQADAYR
jgi:hypothetical protein